MCMAVEVVYTLSSFLWLIIALVWHEACNEKRLPPPPALYPGWITVLGGELNRE